MKTPSGFKYNDDHDLDKCIICGIQMTDTTEPTCSIECEEEREKSEERLDRATRTNNPLAERKLPLVKAESGDFIQITQVTIADNFEIGDIFQVDMRASSMGACEDDSLMTVEEHVVTDDQYIIHKRRYPSEEGLRQDIVKKVGTLSFAQLKALARHLRI